MKFMIGTAALFLIVTSTPALAQDEPKPQQQEEHKPQDSPKAPAQEKAPPAKPDADQPKDKQAPTEKPAEAPPKTQNQDKQQKAQEKQTEQQTKDQQAQQKQAQQQQKQQQAQSHNAPPPQNGGNANARRIPDDKFRAHFGPQHHFRVARGGNRFQYGGYWFAYSDAWPVGWSYDDDCYIEDDGGVYYLVDVLHPEVRLLVAVQVS
jgi:outer membrane biosynthesis protein TonB